MTLPNSCLWSSWKVKFALVIQTSSVMIFPNMEQKDFSGQIRLLLCRVHFWNAFPAKETPCHTPVLREEEAGHWCLCHNDRKIHCGKEGRVHFLNKEALGMESEYWGECTKHPGVFQSLVSWRYCNGHCAPFVGASHVLLFPTCENKAWSCPISHLLKREHFGSSFHAMECPCTKAGLPDQEGAYWILCHIYRRNLAVKKAIVDLLSEVPMGLVCIHRFDDTVEPGCFQTLVFGVCVMAILIWLFCPVGTNWLCATFPWYGIEWILMPSLTSTLWSTHLMCLLSDPNSCNEPILREQEAAHWYISWNFKGNLV